MFKRGQVVMLPSETKTYYYKQILLSIYGEDKGKLKVSCWSDKGETFSNIIHPQHLYILSDEEIKELP